MNVDFTVVIPVYNAQDTLAETLDSVFAQTIKPVEVIVANDGSTDRTTALLRQYQSTHDTLRVIDQRNAGTAAAYNTGIEASSTQWIIMVSADDILLPSHLENIAYAISSHPNAALVTSNGYYLENGTHRLVYEASPFLEDKCTLAQLINHCFFAVGAAFTREVFDAVNGFREHMFAEDYYFFLSALALGFEHAYAPEPTATHRRSLEQKSNRALLMRQEEVRNFELLCKEYSLHEQEQMIVKNKVALLKKNIALRKLLYAVLSEKRAECLIRKLSEVKMSESDSQ